MCKLLSANHSPADEHYSRNSFWLLLKKTSGGERKKHPNSPLEFLNAIIGLCYTKFELSSSYLGPVLFFKPKVRCFLLQEVL